ncbi:hypothetical protein A2Z67_02515 [Candidatus Woesebacteria bacterium RBG_13_36_22]|uniref:Uncharacterized protein n=1 Tax=Candidatus Woesebacteria bacterium RBG_13_36_22 TaxID=1802478 RepID=A0A1F7X3A3_9BACT|nr:MAG: hypothetical protein A2Z67_02515 [Candidatus Woesebacteria bacterium RBG_13_36_22]
MPKDNRFWNDLQRCIDELRIEIKEKEPDRITMDFWLFKIEHRIKMLKEYIEKIEKSNNKSKIK